MEIGATVCTETSFESSSLTLTLQHGGCKCPYVNQFKLPLQPIIVKDLIRKEKKLKVSAAPPHTTAPGPFIRCYFLTDRLFQQTLKSCYRSQPQNEKLYNNQN